MGPQIRAVATEDCRHVHDGVLLCLEASGSAREVLGAQEAMACTIAETMGWENLPTAIRMAESLTIDAGTRRRFAEALAPTPSPRVAEGGDINPRPSR